MTDFFWLFLLLSTNLWWFWHWKHSQKMRLKFADLWKQECIARCDDFIKEHAPEAAFK